jgi:hypothetical protein
VQGAAVSKAVKVLGTLSPMTAPSLIETVLQQQAQLNDFTGGAPVPRSLAKFAKECGYVTVEKQGMLFAHTAGVGIHTDEHPALLWILSGCSQPYMYDNSHELIVNGKSVKLADGMVLWFDATKPHGLIACTNTLWSCFSVYVK